eukprot:TRINITY_DN8882_c0_g1_i1.p1 TRINITY_DN8882_c0_g1~~TRINITY_DN8882_c0_g1_i1.p1  ORF type:complete len:1162 (+),score=193.77 TRINITY_DN8882_c0_g1_i1:856-4341(+)
MILSGFMLSWVILRVCFIVIFIKKKQRGVKGMAMGKGQIFYLINVCKVFKKKDFQLSGLYWQAAWKYSLWLILCVWALRSAGDDFLLTDNNMPGWVSNAITSNEKRITTGAKLLWVTEGEFKSDSELQKSGSRPDDSNRVLLDGRIGSEGQYQAFGKWSGGVYYGSFIIDLKSQYLITRTAVWSLQTNKQKMESFEILLSNDGDKFISMGTYSADQEVKSKKGLGVKFEYLLPKPALAKYVKFRVKKTGGAMQMILSEIAVWGKYPPSGENTKLLPENQRPEVNIKISGIQSGAALLDWSDFAGKAGQVKKWKLYESAVSFGKITDEGVTLKAAYDPKLIRKVIYPLTPGKSYYWGITAEYEDGEYPHTQTIAYTPPLPFSRETFGDMLAINHFWGGGGARFVKRSAEWEQVAIDLLATTPFKSIRWWRDYPNIVEKFYAHGIGVLTWPSSENLKFGAQLGIYSYSVGNEPELSGQPVSHYLEGLKKSYKQGKAVSLLNKFSAPNTNVDDIALEWLDEFYTLGAKDYFDVLNLHTYMKTGGGFKGPIGYQNSAPEALFERMLRVHEIMKKHGDSDKPVISTEFGYTECNVGNPAGHITPEMKAQYLVRGLIIHYVLDFKRVYVYSFWDEGSDPNYTEHAFGMLDHQLQKKPAYYAVCNLGEQLGKTTEFVPMTGVEQPHFGYVFKFKSEKNPVSVIWDGSGSFCGTFSTTPGKIELVSMYGNKRELYTDADGKFRLIFDGSPVYIHAKSPVKLLASEKVNPVAQAENEIELSLNKNVYHVLSGENKSIIDLKVKNLTPENHKVKVRLEDSSKKVLGEKLIGINSSAEVTHAFSVPAPITALEEYTISISYQSKHASFYKDKKCFVRKLQPNNGRTNVSLINMHGWDKDIACISNDFLEVTVDPFRGGRILEMLDKTTGVNHINLPYEKLGDLASIAFYYCIWDQVRSDKEFGVSRNAVYELKKIPNGIKMKINEPGKLAVEKTIILTPKASIVTLTVEVTNNSTRELPVSYYLHPEYTVGGGATSNVDVIILPIAGQKMKIPFWNGLGDRKTGKLDAGWWAVIDTDFGIELKQEFSPDKFRDPRLWFGIGCYNLEMETPVDLKLKPGESWKGILTWKYRKIKQLTLSLIHISEPTRPLYISYAVFCLKKKKKTNSNSSTII